MARASSGSLSALSTAVWAAALMMMWGAVALGSLKHGGAVGDVQRVAVGGDDGGVGPGVQLAHELAADLSVCAGDKVGGHGGAPLAWVKGERCFQATYYKRDGWGSLKFIVARRRLVARWLLEWAVRWLP